MSLFKKKKSDTVNREAAVDVKAETGTSTSQGAPKMASKPPGARREAWNSLPHGRKKETANILISDF